MVSSEFPCKRGVRESNLLQVRKGVKLSSHCTLQNTGKKIVFSKNLPIFKALTIKLANLFKPKLILYIDLRSTHSVIRSWCILPWETTFLQESLRKMLQVWIPEPWRIHRRAMHAAFSCAHRADVSNEPPQLSFPLSLGMAQNPPHIWVETYLSFTYTTCSSTFYLLKNKSNLWPLGIHCEFQLQFRWLVSSHHHWLSNVLLALASKFRPGSCVSWVW